MRTVNRIAILLEQGSQWSWLATGTVTSLTKAGWYSEKIKENRAVHFVPLVLLSDPHFPRRSVVEAVNRCGGEIVWGETDNPEFVALAVISGLDALLATLWHLCGRVPDTAPPASWEAVPDFVDPAAVAALRGRYGQ